MCVFKTSGGLETALHLAPSRIMHIYVGMNRQNPLKHSNVKWLLLIKLLRLWRGMCLCSPRQVYDCSTAIHFKSVFIPVTFMAIIADMNPVKNYSVITLFLPAKVRYFLLVMHQIMMAFGLIVK